VKLALIALSFLSVTEVYAGQCANALTSPWVKVEFSVQNDKPGENPRLMRIKGNGPRTGTATVVSEEKLKELTFMLAKEPYAYQYPEEGCFMRAHMMAKKLESLGILSAKVFAWGSNFENTLRIKNPYTLKWNYWRYHIAVSLVLKTSEGEYVPMIIDPSLSFEPLTVAEWFQLMLPTRASELNPPMQRVRLKVTDRYEYYPPGYPDFNSDQFFYEEKKDWSDKDTYKALTDLEFYSSFVNPSRKEHWKNRLRAPAHESAEPLSTVMLTPDWIHEERDSLWVGFAGKSAYYRIVKQRPGWEQLSARIREARARAQAVQVTIEAHSLEIKN
jgi:hypothetical protein